MKIRRFYLCVLLWMGTLSAVQAQSFDNLWEQTEQAWEKRLPQTAISLTEKIYQKAEQEKNVPQMLKAYLWRIGLQEHITPDSLYTGLNRLEQWIRHTNSPTDRAILHSLIADMYAEYAVDKYRTLHNRTTPIDETPSEDIREWTVNMLADTVRTHISEALKEEALLLKTSSQMYIPFVEQGETSQFYHHDMYHLLASRAMESLEKIKSLNYAKKEIEEDRTTIYQNMLAAYHAEGCKEACLLTTLNYLQAETDTYVATLNQLKDEYQSDSICIEVYIALAHEFENKKQLPEALQLCDEAIRLYPHYYRINDLENMRKRIQTPYLNVSMSGSAFPAEDVALKVSHKNLDGFTLYLYQAEQLIQKRHYVVDCPADYQKQDATVVFKAPEVGIYKIHIVPDVACNTTEDKELYVTRLKVLTHDVSEKQCEAIVVDAQTGHPISDARLMLYDKDNKLLKELTTNTGGKIIINWDNEYRFLKAVKGTDSNMPSQRISHSSVYNSTPTAQEHVKLLTDRSLYRPGQTVYVKGIAYIQQADTANVVPNKNYTVSLLDANRQKVGESTVQTNEFGSFTTSFSLPVACLNGTFSLNAGTSGTTTIRVEEYKRPTFDVILENLQGSYKLGDEVEVGGKIQSYSGISLQGLVVHYVVTRSTYHLIRFAENEPIASGEVIADENGAFAIPVRLNKKEDNGKDNDDEKAYYRYSVEATVTNAAGETQSSVCILSVGNRPLILQMQIDKKICKDQPPLLIFDVRNLDGQPIDVQGTYTLYAAKSDNRQTIEEKPIISGAFTSNRDTTFQWSHLPSGVYILKASVTDEWDRKVTATASVTLFSTNDRRPPLTTTTWLYEANTEFDAEHPAVLYFGTSEQDTYVMMDVFCGKQLLESKALHLSDTIVRIEHPYQESYGNGLFVNFCMVRNGQMFQENVELRKRLSDKKLTMKWNVFRDKLRPGQQEEWKLTITTPQGKPAEAEMLALMYDASLDKIWKQLQNFSVAYNLSIPHILWKQPSYSNYQFHFSWENSYDGNIPQLTYDHFTAPPIITRHVSTRILTTKNISTENNIQASSKTMTDGTENSSGTSVTLRTNFAETAFFYPQLHTDENGEISIAFTVPESLTRWNFLSLSHTKGMLTGTLENEIITNKEFMLTSNPPRFVRVGDNVSIPVTIYNLTRVTQSGTITMTLLDPVTGKIVTTQVQEFSTTAGKAESTSFMFTANDEYKILCCRLMADGTTFSDGEQQLIPILSHTEHLVETLPLPIRGEETRSFSLDSLFNHHSQTATGRKLTIEFIGNLAWYAIQALPSLNFPTNNNAISWATAYYVNTLSSFIMNSQPHIKTLFDSWKLQEKTEDTSLSNLQKNQELKNILLSESPWVLEAQTEYQQTERLTTLFDLNNIRNNQITAQTKLQELQNADGAWVWYKGMDSSRYITTYIAILNARLAMLTGESLTGIALNLQKKALDYLHREALNDYEQILETQKKKGSTSKGVSKFILEYLYLMAISNEQVPETNKEAYTYYLSKVSELLASDSMENKALTAIILYKSGRMDEAHTFIASLKEHLIQTDEQGMFFAFHETPYEWGRMALQAHVYVMEALNMEGGNSETVEEMKLWLLKQKQLQQWSSPIATADAVYALLMTGDNLLSHQGDARITIGDDILETINQSAISSLGYVKYTFTQEDVVNTRTVKVEKKDSGIAWGAVYAEYDSPISDVRQQGDILDIQKRLYVEHLVNNTPRLQPITNESTLHVGDKVIVRLTIRADRPMDFVQLKDQRGGCFEPIDAISDYHWNNEIGYYMDVKDASTNFFFDHLGKGIYTLEYSYHISRAGTYETGLATMQCVYAPEYATHSGRMTISVME